MAGPHTSAAAPAGSARRPAGSDAERRAANAFAAQAREAGLTATVTGFSIWPRGGLPQALLTIAAIVGGLVASSAAAPGAAVVAAATVLFVLDATGIAQPVRHLLGRRMSQNVEVEAGRDDRPGTVVITAPLDTPRSRGAMQIATRLLRDPYLAATLAMALLLACCALRVAGLDSGALTAVQFVPTVLLILLVPAFLDAAIASPTADETAGAAGVALALASELDLTYFQPRVLLTGATATNASGMRRWLRANRGKLPRETTAVVCLDTTSGGSLAFSTREGAVLSQRSHRDLLRLAREVAEDGGGVAETTRRESTNASRAAARRLPAIGIEAGAEAPDQLRTFARELIERLDADLGPSLGD